MIYVVQQKNAFNYFYLLKMGHSWSIFLSITSILMTSRGDVIIDVIAMNFLLLFKEEQVIRLSSLAKTV